MAADVRVMLARRPGSPGAAAFGHVDVSAGGRNELEAMLVEIMRRYIARTEVPYHPDDEADDEEVLVAPLAGFDEHFQPNAAWSLERCVEEIRASKLPKTLGAAEIREGAWSFHALRTAATSHDIVAVRAISPMRGLNSANKIVTAFTGNELKPFKQPLLTFDERADALVVDGKVYVASPRSVENLLIDAAAVKARAPQTTKAFVSKLSARLSPTTIDAIERVCSHNAVIARRVERLTRNGTLSHVTVAKMRQALPNAALASTDFGSGKAIEAPTDDRAKVLIDIAADLYYQPLFDNRPRRVASYRRLR